MKNIDSSTDISESSVQTILKKHMHLRKICAIWVPHLLTAEQNKQHLNCAWELPETRKTEKVGLFLTC